METGPWNESRSASCVESLARESSSHAELCVGVAELPSGEGVCLGEDCARVCGRGPRAFKSFGVAFRSLNCLFALWNGQGVRDSLLSLPGPSGLRNRRTRKTRLEFFSGFGMVLPRWFWFPTTFKVPVDKEFEMSYGLSMVEDVLEFPFVGALPERRKGKVALAFEVL